MSKEIPENVQLWTAKRRAALLLSILKGEPSIQEADRTHGLTMAEVEDWKEEVSRSGRGCPSCPSQE
jgi:hypothetical protein